MSKMLREICPRYEGKTASWWKAGHTPLLDVLKYIGLPPSEVACARASGEWIPPEYRCSGGERLVFAAAGRIRTDTPQEWAPHCWSDPLTEKPRFICDVHLGKLTRNLRLLGYDVCYETHQKDQQIVHRAQKDARVILTRDRNLLMRTPIQWGHWLQETDPRKQVVEVLQRWGKREDAAAFSRCMECNEPLEMLPIDQVHQRVPEDVRERQHSVWHCPRCNRIYWQGSHYEAMSRSVRQWLDQAFGEQDETLSYAD
jgi:uncharacterized protein with PIN domain